MVRTDPTSCAPSRRKWLGTALVGGIILVAVLTTFALAQDFSARTPAQAVLPPLTLGKVFTFLALTLGPFNVVGPFVEMTRGRDAVFRRRLAFEGTLIAALALLVAGTLGADTLTLWGVSAAALFVTVGILLFLVGLRFVRAQYQPRELQAEGPRVGTTSEPRISALAFSPLAFPTIVTPYGIAILVLALTLPPDDTLGDLQILGVAALVLAADLLAMLAAERILETPYVAAAFGIVGSVMAVLQIALGIQAIIIGLRLLGVESTSGT